jgi:HlyD family secretion protein
VKRSDFTQNRLLSVVVVATALILAAGAFVLWPAFTNPESRIYTTALGYLKIQRLLGIEMQATAQHPVWHDFETPILGEGTLQCDFYNVPLLPKSRLTALYVDEGDSVKEGQTLAKLDDSNANMNLGTAKLALATAIAEQLRIETGSPYTLQSERPDKDRTSINGLANILKNAQTKVDIFSKLKIDGSASRVDLVGAESFLATAQLNYDQAKNDLGMSTAGLPKSKEIAQNQVDAAEYLVAESERELNYCSVKAPASGTIDRVLVRLGEYNQMAGNPGFIIASGLWFEANLDQLALTDLHEGMEGTVNLEAYAGRTFHATVERIIPIVTFNTGGPETKTPVKPLGTGNPEWPATFAIRLHLDASDVKLVPGMTGFVRLINRHRNSLAIPREALSSLSAGKGVVRTVDDSGHPVTTPVSFGEVDERYVEITAGLNYSSWVLTNNPRFLRDDDKIRITRVAASEN